MNYVMDHVVSCCCVNLCNGSCCLMLLLSYLVVDVGILLVLFGIDPGHNLLLFIIDVDPIIHCWYLE